MSSTNSLTSASAPTADVQYSLVFQNQSDMNGYACVYQTSPDDTGPSVVSLAWLSKFVFPSTQVIFKWATEYSFVWAETGELMPGVQFIASQLWSADLQFSNQVTFSQRDGMYQFTDLRQGQGPGSLYIMEDSSIPPGSTAAVGIGMSGNSTLAVQAEPNMFLALTPPKTYWVAFGNYSQGQVLDTTQIINAAPVVFPPNVYSLTATLAANNTITVRPTAQVNASLLAARRAQ